MGVGIHQSVPTVRFIKDYDDTKNILPVVRCNNSNRSRLSCEIAFENPDILFFGDLRESFYS